LTRLLGAKTADDGATVVRRAAIWGQTCELSDYQPEFTDS